MKKLLIISIVSTLLLCSVPAFADTTLAENFQEQEPDFGTISYKDESMSIYCYEPITIKYLYDSNLDEWHTVVLLENYEKLSNMPNLKDYFPHVQLRGKEKEKEITDNFYIYLGDGLNSNWLLTKIQNLEMQINK